MIEIKLIFLLIGSFFMLEQPSLFAPKAVVTVDPIKKTVQIDQIGMISTDMESDVLKNPDYLKIKDKEVKWVAETDAFSNKEVSWSVEGNKLSSSIRMNYTDEHDLWAMGIFYEENKFSIITDQNMKVLKGKSKQEGDHLHFEVNEPFSFEVNMDPKGMEIFEGNGADLRLKENLRGFPLFGKKSNEIREQTFQRAEIINEVFETMDAGPSFSVNRVGNKALVNGDVEAEFDFKDNNILRIKLSKDIPNFLIWGISGKLYRYSFDCAHRVLTLNQLDDPKGLNKKDMVLYFKGIE
ncbi:hypothetical protein [Sphingobacterium sp. CZ-2]|uniref:hypothetical protein n=1 Tax=Sphingobacterium sp. CZ-2 TaxID=2557994 RepID=UPI00106F61EE|nr:hypothetical protein [Sphingobacterium sp. CZ-2]QBR13717.1 hypothetical protein E3D81_16620 [Sphingobacterium sp. CZ-2]